MAVPDVKSFEVAFPFASKSRIVYRACGGMATNRPPKRSTKGRDYDIIIDIEHL